MGKCASSRHNMGFPLLTANTDFSSSHSCLGSLTSPKPLSKHCWTHQWQFTGLHISSQRSFWPAAAGHFGVEVLFSVWISIQTSGDPLQHYMVLVGRDLQSLPSNILLTVRLSPVMDEASPGSRTPRHGAPPPLQVPTFLQRTQPSHAKPPSVATIPLYIICPYQRTRSSAIFRLV